MTPFLLSFKNRGLAYIILFGISLRFLGLFDNLWLDEIWAWILISGISSPFEIITRLFHENNHLLSSFFIYFVGSQDPGCWFKFRLLSFVLGILSIAVVYLVTARTHTSKAWRLITTLLAAVSFPLVLYSCEARGYMPVVFFSLSSFYLISEYFRKENPWILFFFQCCFFLGFMSHFSFAYTGAGLFILSVFLVSKRPSPFIRKMAIMLKLFAIPLVIASISYFYFINRLVSGGGEGASLSNIINETMAHLAGYPGHGGYLITFFVSLLLIYATIFLIKDRSGLGVFCLSSILVIWAHLLFNRPKILYFRYFICIFPFLIILMSYSLYLLWRKYPRWRAPLAALVILIAAGNIKNDVGFIAVGRGDYLRALNYMYDHTGSAQMTITSDHDFRSSMLLEFYNLFYRGGKKMVYVPIGKVQKEGTEWFIAHRFGKDPRMPDSIALNGRIKYKLEKHYPYCGTLSGFHWFIYHRAADIPQVIHKVADV